MTGMARSLASRKRVQLQSRALGTTASRDTTRALLKKRSDGCEAGATTSKSLALLPQMPEIELFSSCTLLTLPAGMADQSPMTPTRPMCLSASRSLQSDSALSACQNHLDGSFSFLKHHATLDTATFRNNPNKISRLQLHNFPQNQRLKLVTNVNPSARGPGITD